MAFILTVMFFGILYFFVQNYRHFDAARKKIATLEVKARLMEQQRAELQNKKRALDRVSSHMAKARSLGLASDQWTVFEVNVEAPVTFGTMELILNQCTNSAYYYFKPISLRIKTALAQDETVSGNGQPTEASRWNEGGKGDGLLMIKGAFIARNK